MTDFPPRFTAVRENEEQRLRRADEEEAYLMETLRNHGERTEQGLADVAQLGQALIERLEDRKIKPDLELLGALKVPDRSMKALGRRLDGRERGTVSAYEPGCAWSLRQPNGYAATGLALDVGGCFYRYSSHDQRNDRTGNVGYIQDQGESYPGGIADCQDIEQAVAVFMVERSID
jgi:hypothetical protein